MSDVTRVIIAAEHVPQAVAKKLLRYEQSLHHIAELECSSEAADRDRVPCPAEHDQRYECCCAFGFLEPEKHSDVPRVSAKSKRIEYQVRVLCAPLGIVPVFSGDPRGAVLKLTLPSGKTYDPGTLQVRAR